MQCFINCNDCKYHLKFRQTDNARKSTPISLDYRPSLQSSHGAKFSIFPKGVGKYSNVIVRGWPSISNSAERKEEDSFRNS